MGFCSNTKMQTHWALRYFRAFVVFTLFLLLPNLGRTQPAADPALVHVGVYINRINDMSLRDNRFVSDFYIWFRWQDKDLKPYESFEIANGHMDSRETIYQDVVEGFQYAVVRVTATITKYWDIRHFPLDNHVLTLEIEDSQNEDFKFKYIADADNSTISPDVQVPGWDVGASQNQVMGHEYKTNYGDISLPSGNASSYSRYVFSVNLNRPGYGYFNKLFLSLFLATLISFLAFAIKPTDLDPRFGLGIGAIFAVAASQYVVASSLPDSNIMTMADALHILSITFIFLSLVESTISLKLATGPRPELSQKLDRISLVLFILTYITFILIIVFCL